MVEVDDARAYGCVPLSKDGRVLDFLEKMDNPIAKTINAGCYIFSAATLEKIPARGSDLCGTRNFPTLTKIWGINLWI